MYDECHRYMQAKADLHRLYMRTKLLVVELEGEATNLDTQVTKRLYICIYVCIYVRHSQLQTPHSWPRNTVKLISFE